ncbi:hypothetical protein TNCV_1192641 [Trichonephila clavipes]|nr:hypothetical protein TNCV_1192641 [Trichonephila clavipes]
MLKHLRSDIFELQEKKLGVRLINTTNEWSLVKGHDTPMRVKGDIEDVSTELDNGGIKNWKTQLPKVGMPGEEFQRRPGPTQSCRAIEEEGMENA